MSWEINDVLQLIVAFLAFYGAALSTLIFFEKHLRKIHVEMSYGFIPETAEEQLIVGATNTAMRPVTLNSCEIHAANSERKLHIAPRPGINCIVPLPNELKDGGKHIMFLPVREVAKNFNEEIGATGKLKIWGVFRSSVGKEYSSKKLEINIGNWLNHND